MTESEYRSYITPTRGRPTRESISEALGFTIPARFAEFVVQIYDLAEGKKDQCEEIFQATLGFLPVGLTYRSVSTPPELFPIGSTMCDGDHFGFLILAPEIDLQILPLGYYCPMDSDGVSVIGTTIEAAIASQMNTVLSARHVSDHEKTLMQSLSELSGIDPIRELNPRIFVPQGWFHLPSSDGVGSLGPSGWFSLDPIFDISKWTVPEEYVWAADVFIKKGEYGTALHYLREGLWRYCWEGNRMIGEKTSDLYRLMGREPLAEVLEWTMANRWRPEADSQ